WPEWSPAARTAIRKLAAQFKPSFQPPQGKFSAWHYFVIERSANPAAYRYTKPVVVLIDAGCFSATDIFVGAFAARPAGVKLVGTPTSGGSGRARGHTLAHSGIRLRVSSMASFRPTGDVYDTNGILPDVIARPAAADWVAGSDTVLEAALEALK
ncbi:MAG: S41 family peptidase, partial [Planctomycetota bacterium]|nr:S41 family peptidase [Planctomycetota bacterium]